MLENKIGGLIPVEVVLTVPVAMEQTQLDQIREVKNAVDALQNIEGIETLISALNFLPPLPSQTSSAVRIVAQRSAMNTMLSRRTEQIKASRFLDQDESGNFWRISLRIKAGEHLDYKVLIADIEDTLETTVPSEMQFTVTGAVPLVHKAQEQLLTDLTNSFLSAFILIAMTMVIMLRGIVRGLLAMIPNVFPCVIVFGTMGLLGLPIDMGTMMTASVAMGIAVDGTIHFLTWVNSGLRNGLERSEAVMFAYRQCATALTQTTIICGFGMLVFSLSNFVPVANFSILLFSILIASWVGDIIVMPAILFSPIGKVFVQHKSGL